MEIGTAPTPSKNCFRQWTRPSRSRVQRLEGTLVIKKALALTRRALERLRSSEVESGVVHGAKTKRGTTLSAQAVSDPWAFGWTQLLTLIGFVITIGIALGGFRTFNRWKREKLEEKRIDAAINVLAIGYEAKFVFNEIRARYVRAGEDVAVILRKGAKGTPLTDNQRGPYAVLKRLRAHHEFFERVYKIEPLIMAIFGKEMQEVFRHLYEARALVETAAETLLELERTEAHDKNARDERIALRRTIFASSAGGIEGDRVGDLVERFTRVIANTCGPIVDEEFGKIRVRRGYVVTKQK